MSYLVNAACFYSQIMQHWKQIDQHASTYASTFVDYANASVIVFRL